MVLFHRNRAWRLYKELSKNPKGIEEPLEELKEAVYHKSGKEAYRLGLALQKKKKLSKNWIEHTKEGIIAILFALIAATIIRTMWFELYEIPSGSMRPTFQEGDHLVASKISFGINVPLIPEHFFFEPNLVQHDQVVIFTVDNMAVQDPDTTYFLLFPGKRMLIKRLIGLPGDHLYFTQGKIYGVNKEGEKFTIESEHVPYINFEGRISTKDHTLLFEQSGQLMAKWEFPNNSFIYKDGHFIKGDYFGASWGLDNYAMVKIMGDELQIASFPSLKDPLFLNNHPLLKPSFLTIPLHDLHKKRLWQLLSTSRFTVKNGRSGGLQLPGVPDGTYQMTKGVFEEVLFASRTKKLPSTHPLYNEELLPILFNGGIDFSNIYTKKALPFYPQRFAYYDQGNLKIDGTIIYTKEDPLLENFVKRQKSTEHPFIDKAFDPTSDFIIKNGLKIPDKMYYVLGDNYTNSADSRDFGFLPEDNIRGTPSFLFWPPGTRFGPLSKAPWLSTPHAITALIVLALSLASWRYYYKIPRS